VPSRHADAASGAGNSTFLSATGRSIRARIARLTQIDPDSPEIPELRRQLDADREAGIHEACRRVLEQGNELGLRALRTLARSVAEDEYEHAGEVEDEA
jgi:hypothetical protein